MNTLTTVDKIRILKLVEGRADWRWNRSRANSDVTATATIQSDTALSHVLLSAERAGWVDVLKDRTVTLVFDIGEMLDSSELCWRIPKPVEDDK